MNGYIAIYRGKQKEVYAATSYEAQQKAALEWLEAASQPDHANEWSCVSYHASW